MFTHYSVSIVIYGIEKGCRKPTRNHIPVIDIAAAHDTTPKNTLPSGFDLAHAIECSKNIAKQCNVVIRRLDKVVMNINDVEIDFSGHRIVSLLPFYTEVIFQSSQEVKS